MANHAVVLMPTYNERENLPAIVDEVLHTVPVDMLIIDDNSPDGTGELADGIAAKEPRVQVLHRPGKQGLGRAYIDGFRWALERDYRYIFEMDADFSHQPRFLPDFLREIESADVVLGSRWVAGGGVENWSLTRKLISRGGSLYARTILGLGIKDLTGGFKCFRREVLQAIDLDSIQAAGYGFQIEMTYRCARQGFRIKETPIVFPDRKVGASKMSRKIFVEALGMVWKLRFGSHG
ncbi:MAG: polyprenol monophosphomannose synthase [Deltaproteobacteria bacterium]|nr:polyprenol monophosphomannose synthase [Deltaproteobacteria bacterium]